MMNRIRERNRLRGGTDSSPVNPIIQQSDHSAFRNIPSPGTEAAATVTGRYVYRSHGIWMEYCELLRPRHEGHLRGDWHRIGHGHCVFRDIFQRSIRFSGCLVRLRAQLAFAPIFRPNFVLAHHLHWKRNAGVLPTARMVPAPVRPCRIECTMMRM